MKNQKYYDPSEDDGYAALGGYLATVAQQSPQGESSILILIDMSTHAEHIHAVLDACDKEGVKVWKLQIASFETVKE